MRRKLVLSEYTVEPEAIERQLFFKDKNSTNKILKSFKTKNLLLFVYLMVDIKGK